MSVWNYALKKKLPQAKAAGTASNNPYGILSFSPGLTRSGYPGQPANPFNNPERVESITAHRGCNPVGVGYIMDA
jgi:hypothetical protein